jgi:hypothetical protein
LTFCTQKSPSVHYIKIVQTDEKTRLEKSNRANLDYREFASAVSSALLTRLETGKGQQNLLHLLDTFGARLMEQDLQELVVHCFLLSSKSTGVVPG